MQGPDNNIGLVIAAHAPLATGLKEAALRIHGRPHPVLVVDIEGQKVPYEAVAEAARQADQGHGVLILADLFGGTAANLAIAQLGDNRVEVVTGANLAMAIEALSYAGRSSTVKELADKVAGAAKSSVVIAGELLGTHALAGDGVAA